MKSIAFLMLLFMAASLTVCKGASVKNPSLIHRVELSIQLKGSRYTVKELYLSRPQEWQHVLEGVGTGNRAWLSLAIKLSSGADAAPAEDLSNAISEALVGNASNVLSYVVSKDFTLGDICSGPSVNDFNSYDDAIKELRKMEAAVRNISLKSLKRRKLTCLDYLTKSKYYLDKFYGKP